MMYRCMSETLDGSKKNGYVIDLNISRVLNTTLYYNVHKKDMAIEDKLEYLVKNHLINIDYDYYVSKENKTDIIKKLLNI
jgi:hypothetical protein